MKVNKSNVLRPYILLLLLSSILISCKTLNSKVTYSEMMDRTSPKARALMDSPDFKTCNYNESKLFNDILLKCNLWGSNKIKKGVPHLCTYKKGELFGWKWDVPNNAGGVIGYPALQIGVGPWEKRKTSRSGFPVKISSIKDLVVNYDVETHVKHRKYNLAFDLWILDSETNNKKQIKAEIMIWEDYFDFSSYGKKKETIITPFGVYKVMVGYLYNPKYKQDWQYVAFVREHPRSKGTVDINYFMNYLVENDIIGRDLLLSSVEFGNEIGNSSGFTLVNKFEWIFETKN